MRRLVLVMAMLGCGTNSGQATRSESFGASSALGFASYDAAAVPGGPGGGRRYGFGHPPADSLLLALDDDVGPAGAELPPGRGSAAEGARLYAAHCASCHGAAGEGMSPYPPLVVRDSTTSRFGFGADPRLVKSIGSYWPHATTIFDYVKRAMPLNAPGSLTDSDVYALTAWLLAANGVVPEGAVLDAVTLRRVRMPARDRFVPDDRPGGAKFR